MIWLRLSDNSRGASATIRVLLCQGMSFWEWLPWFVISVPLTLAGWIVVPYRYLATIPWAFDPIRNWKRICGISIGWITRFLWSIGLCILILFPFTNVLLAGEFLWNTRFASQINGTCGMQASIGDSQFGHILSG